MNEHHLSAYFGTLMNQIGKLMVSIVNGVKLWQRQKMSKTHNNKKVDFVWLQSKYWLSLRALASITH